MAHTCHAVGCTVAVPPRMLFCLPHWRSVPREWQKRVWAEYRPGQEVDKRPSPEYLLVQAMVVAYVARKAGVYTASQAQGHVMACTERVWQSLSREWVAALPAMDLS